MISAWLSPFNRYSAKIFFYKPRRPKGLFQFEIIINDLR